MEQEHNLAYIDGQNLHLWTQTDDRKVDFHKFRKYLFHKFHVEEAYYFLGYVMEDQQELYNALQRAGFIVLFREHSSALKGKKKGNVDVDIVFEIMKKVADWKKDFDQIVLVTGDGDYIKLVKYLIKHELLNRVVFPNKNHSSLYKKISNKYYYYLSSAKEKVAYSKE